MPGGAVSVHHKRACLRFETHRLSSARHPRRCRPLSLIPSLHSPQPLSLVPPSPLLDPSDSKASPPQSPRSSWPIWRSCLQQRSGGCKASGPPHTTSTTQTPPTMTSPPAPTPSSTPAQRRVRWKVGSRTPGLFLFRSFGRHPSNHDRWVDACLVTSKWCNPTDTRRGAIVVFATSQRHLSSVCTYSRVFDRGADGCAQTEKL